MTEFQHKRTNTAERLQIQALNEVDLRAYQLNRLNELLAQIIPANQFYREKFAAEGESAAPPKLSNLSELSQLPFTVKQNLINESDSAGFAKNLTFAADAYTRFHRTSGTSGRPMIVLDTQNDWNWWMEAWQYVLDSANLTSQDRVLMAFSFGPFIGFWSAFDAVAERGAMVIPTASDDQSGPAGSRLSRPRRRLFFVRRVMPFTWPKSLSSMVFVWPNMPVQ